MWRHISFMFATALVITVDVKAFSLPQWAWLASSLNFFLESMYCGIGVCVVLSFSLENERQESGSIVRVERSTRDESYQCRRASYVFMLSPPITLAKYVATGSPHPCHTRSILSSPLSTCYPTGQAQLKVCSEVSSERHN